MTREAYDPERLDALALRLLDLTGQLRRLAHFVRDEELADVQLHDRKALEWIEKLEQWAVGAETDVDKQAKRAKASRWAREFREEKTK